MDQTRHVFIRASDSKILSTATLLLVKIKIFKANQL